jgi:putative flippase GtrA
MFKSLWEYKKVRFLCAGTMNAVVDLTILNVLVFDFHFPVWLGNTIAVSVAITMSYFLNHRIVFRHHHNPNAKQYLKFFLITGVGVIITQTLIIYLTKATFYKLLHIQIPAFTSNVDTKLSLNIAKLTAAVFGMVWNYLLYSKVVFKKVPIDPEGIEDITRFV